MKNSEEKAAALNHLQSAWDMFKKSWWLIPFESDISAALADYDYEWTDELKKLYDETKKKQMEFQDYFQREVEQAAIELAEATMQERGFKVLYKRIEGKK